MADDLVVREWEEHSDIWVDKAALDDEGALIEIQFPLEEHNDAIKGLKAQLAASEAALLEATAELIYLRLYGKDGAVWRANESKDVWRDKARKALAEPKDGES